MLAVSRELARFVSYLKFENIPSKVINRAKILLRDFIGIAIRARHEAKSTLAMMRATAALMRKNSVIPRTDLAEENLSTFCARISI